MCEADVGMFILGLAVVTSAPIKGKIKVIGSSQPIVATVGDDVILPCLAEPPVEENLLMVEWLRPDLPFDPADPQSQNKYVHWHHNGMDKDDAKLPQYAGRTELNRDSLKNSNMSLKITKVRLSDQGIYVCFLPKIKSPWGATKMRLIVEPKPGETTKMTESPSPFTLQFFTEEPKGIRKAITVIYSFVALMIIIVGLYCWYMWTHLCQSNQNRFLQKG
ncbi:myelin-oligodendrocyte glycoprotein-like isoform 1-T1 [Pholidichthys leucotaenia]